jgi:L-alanine-DL-glutamate epimerase-like enolase superfamily enzyme
MSAQSIFEFDLSPIKLRDVHSYILRYPDPNDFGTERMTVVVRLETREGIVGWGEGIAMWPEACRATALLVEEGLGPLLLQTEDLTVESAWHKMRAHTWWYGEGGIASFALSALDMALWDLQGQLVNKSLSEMLGGRYVERLPATASCHVNKATLEECVDEVAGFADKGFRSVKLGFAKKGLSQIGRDPELDVRFIASLRSRLGPEIEILVDAGNGVHWDLDTAIRTVSRMQEYGIGWIEEPFYPTNLADYSKLKSAVSVPIASGEREWTVTGYKRLIESKTVDIVGVDPARAEGITGFRQVDALCGAAGLKINAHAWSTAITTAASLHLSLASKNSMLFELKPFPVVVQQELITEPITQHDGWVQMHKKPGLGITVREDVLHRFAIAR